MNLFSDFLVIMLTAIVLQNAIFTRGLGSSKDIITLNSTGKVLCFGGFLVVFTFFSALLSYPCFFLLRQYAPVLKATSIRYLYFSTTLICTCIVFTSIYLLTRTYFPMLFYHFRPMTAPLLFNCAVMGTILIAFRSGFGLIQTLGFAVGSSIGYTCALLMVYEGRRRISICDIPRAFRGLPVMLLYVGIVSLAIYGLIGHQLPT